MAGRAKHAERSHKTHYRNELNSKYFYNSNAVRASVHAIKKRESLFARIMGLIKKGDR